MWRSFIGLRTGMARATRSASGLRLAMSATNQPKMGLYRNLAQQWGQKFRGYATEAAKQAPKKKMTLKDLAKEYGWTGAGVYLTLSALDLPLFFLLVHSAGEDTFVDLELQIRKAIGLSTDENDLYIKKGDEAGHGKLLAEFGVAYVLHKLFMVVRVPLTVAITPGIAKQLQRWGFKIGPTVTAGKAATSTAEQSSKAAVGVAGVSEATGTPKKDFGRPPTKRNKWLSWLM